MLLQLITYLKDYTACGCTKNYEKKEEKSLITKTSEGCREIEEKTIGVAVEIPPTVPTEFSFSKVIKVIYSIRVSGKILFISTIHFDPEYDLIIIERIFFENFLQVKACTPAFYKSTVLNLPITIGSYPFNDNAMP